MSHSHDPHNPSRRRLMQMAGATALATALPLAASRTAFAQARQLIVSDPGGPYTSAYRRAFYDPFEKATGIKVVSVARDSQPVAQFAAMVQTKNFVWDVTTLTLSADIPYLESKGFLEPVGMKAADFPGIMPEAVTPDWLGVDVYSTVLAYRTDKFPKEAPQTWADFWDVKRFPGRRSLRRSPLDTLEQALMADGVPIDKLYPLDLDRAFKSLDRIKPHINLWWTSGAQAMQAIQSGDVDMMSTWNGRAQAAASMKKMSEIRRPMTPPAMVNIPGPLFFGLGSATNSSASLLLAAGAGGRTPVRDWATVTVESAALPFSRAMVRAGGSGRFGSPTGRADLAGVPSRASLSAEMSEARLNT